MKYKKIKNKLIANYDWSTEIDEHHKEMIMDVNEIVSNHYQQIIDDLRKELADKEKVYQISIDMISAQLKHEIGRGKLIQSFFDRTSPIHKI